jgi:hypothetical protein
MQCSTLCNIQQNVFVGVTVPTLPSFQWLWEVGSLFTASKHSVTVFVWSSTSATGFPPGAHTRSTHTQVLLCAQSIYHSTSYFSCCHWHEHAEGYLKPATVWGPFYALLSDCGEVSISLGSMWEKIILISEIDTSIHTDIRNTNFLLWSTCIRPGSPIVVCTRCQSS